MSITSTSLSGGIATFGYTASSAPAAGEVITITNTVNGGGFFNLVGAVIASVNTSNSTFAVAGLSSTTTYAITAEVGTAGPSCNSNLNGATFSLTPSTPTITVAASTTGESSGSATLTVNSYGGWSGVLNFSCSGLPKYATCVPYPGSPLVTASTPGASLTPTQIQFFVKTNVPPLVPTASVGRGREFGVALSVLIQEAAIHAVCVGRYKIDCGPALLRMREKFWYPTRPCSGGTTNAQLRIDALDRVGCQLKELEVSLLIRILPKAGEIGLVPHLKEPRPHLILP